MSFGENFSTLIRIYAVFAEILGNFYVESISQPDKTIIALLQLINVHILEKNCLRVHFGRTRVAWILQSTRWRSIPQSARRLPAARHRRRLPLRIAYVALGSFKKLSS